ncbi:MAG: polysaccharide pyruvyl transferase family protein [Eubacteriales bacterium]|nr:polysaccharide pyruvyl transferase family protein [Eubacteriales bacterium]
MEIAVITWFSNLNFGTALQAQALQDYLKSHSDTDVKLINYLPSESNILQSVDKKTEHIVFKVFNKIKEKIHNDNEIYNNLLSGKFKNFFEKKKENFDVFMSEIDFTEEVSSKEDFKKIADSFDTFICGSDQIWNPQILDKNYYLDFVHGKNKIAYAASFGIGYLPDYSKPYIKEYLSDFKAIGLRENTCKDELCAITQRDDISVVCDPTLLFDKEYWSKKGNTSVVPKEKYFVTYFLGSSSIVPDAVKKVQDTLKIKNVVLPSTEYTLNICDKENISYGPSEFISLIENAEFVLTDSFHATCFSVIFGKKFCVLKKHSQSNPFRQNSRIESFLSTLGISERLVQKNSSIFEFLAEDIDYVKVYEKLDEFRESSKKFIERNVFND